MYMNKSVTLPPCGVTVVKLLQLVYPHNGVIAVAERSGEV
jgi:hypothetical protein